MNKEKGERGKEQKRREGEERMRKGGRKEEGGRGVGRERETTDRGRERFK